MKVGSQQGNLGRLQVARAVIKEQMIAKDVALPRARVARRGRGRGRGWRRGGSQC